MCELCPKALPDWQGWLELPPRSCGAPAGEWLDLTHPLSAAMPCASIFPKPSFTRIQSLPADPFNITEIRMITHAGTHIDAPSHCILAAPAIDAIPLDRLSGPGVVWHIDATEDAIIEPADLERCRPHVREGDILAVDTGWARHVGTPRYDRHPSFSAEAAAWLLKRRIKLLACDFATPDLVYHRRQPGFDWPVHRLLLGHGILISEHLTGHAALAGEHAEFHFNALPIAGGDGAPARVIARQTA